MDILAGEYNENISIQGNGKCTGSLVCSKDIRACGMFVCEGSVKCSSLLCAGLLDVAGEIEAEQFSMAGLIRCGGLLNAEKIDISLDQSRSSVGAIGGSEIRVCIDKKTNKKRSRLPLISKLLGREDGALTVKEVIEGDIIALEAVQVPKVVGRIVAIGEECVINYVQYSEEIEIHPSAKVGQWEKI